MAKEDCLSTPDDEEFGFAPDYDSPIPYMHRIRTYYLTLGFGTPYRWAHYRDVPFTPMAKPLSEATIALITTAAPYRPEAGDQGPGAPYNSAAKFYTVYSGDARDDHDLRISHVGIDRKHTTAEDPGTWFALPALRDAAARGLIGKVAPRFHGAPTNRSHKTTLEVDAQELLARVKEDRADAVVIAGN
jgi:D-proline reductase (dithiol) PrdB